MNKPDAILTADWHLRSDNPICRTDDFIKAQFKKVRFIKRLQNEHNCPVLCAGDIFNHWKPSPRLLSKTMKYMPGNMVCIAGNHDLPAHSLERIDESGFNVLDEADYINYEPAALEFNFSLHVHHFGTEYIKPGEKWPGMRRVALIHEYVYKGRKPFPGQLTGVTALMKKLKGYDLIVVGDNHVPFVHRAENQLVVNSGSLTRQTADQIKHRPRVYLWYAKTNTVKPVYIPIEKNVITRTHIKKDKERDSRIEAFITALETGCEIHLQFEKNIENVLRTLDNKAVKQKIVQAMEGSK